MKLFFTLFFSLAFHFVYSQETKYHFDYFTIYDAVSKNKEVNKMVEITFSNSQDNGYYLHMHIKGDTVSGISLRDNSKNLVFHFKNVKYSELDFNALLKNSEFHPYRSSIFNTRPVTSFFDYEVKYETVNSNRVIHIIKYKNKRRKKIIEETFLETKKNDLAKNQQYNIPDIAYNLWNENFKINNSEVITKYFLKKEEEKFELWNLKEINNTDITLTINTGNTPNQ